MIGIDEDEPSMAAGGTEGDRNKILTTSRFSLDNGKEVNLLNGENRRRRGFEGDWIVVLKRKRNRTTTWKCPVSR